MTEWLLAFDKSMKKQKRKVVLFMDNATSHPPEMKLKHVKIILLPANTTSHCQPLDQGIIQNMKVHYRRMLMSRILLEIDKYNSADELANTISVLDANHMD